MRVFENYARYYDLLYRDKDYVAESRFICSIIQKYSPDAKSILELGCGTGAHAQNLISEGLEVHGVDLSSEMLKCAHDRLSKLPKEHASRLTFSQGDIRHVRLDKQFDVVISLFHVMSYQTTNKDLESAFATAVAHLRPGGVFIFDCWFGPAVLTEKPSVRMKRLEDEVIRVVRIAEPVMHPSENVVDVNYHVFITDKSSSNVKELSETHRMRYLFKPEVEMFLSQNGLTLLDGREWLTGNPLGVDTWSSFFVARA